MRRNSSFDRMSRFARPTILVLSVTALLFAGGVRANAGTIYTWLPTAAGTYCWDNSSTIGVHDGLATNWSPAPGSNGPYSEDDVVNITSTSSVACEKPAERAANSSSDFMNARSLK